MHRELMGWAFTALIMSSTIVSTFSYPNGQIIDSQSSQTSFYPSRSIPNHQEAESRKLAVKSNSLKKVALDDVEDLQTNQLSEGTGGGGGGFSWSNLLGMVMQMIFSPAANQGPNKSEGLDEGPVSQSPWANLLAVGLKILSAFLGGGAQPSDGIDKVDNGGSPLQFINIVVNLLEALKTSFSHRSLAARHLGKKDSVSDATVAGISMMKGYVRSLSASDNKCIEKYLCEASNECSTDIGQGAVFCRLGGYAVSYLLDKSVEAPSFDVLYQATRRGRFANDCRQHFLECNEV